MEEKWVDRYKFSLVIPHDLKEKLIKVAKKEHRTLTGQIIHLLETALETANEPTTTTD